MPTAKLSSTNLSSTLNGLFEGETTSTSIESPVLIADPRVIATYKDDEDRFAFAFVCELAVANSLGAALTMIPAGGADDATKAGEVPDNIGENLHEVLNICSSIFADFAQTRIVLGEVFTPGKTVPNEVAERLADAECMTQIEYEVKRYQSGKISLFRIG